MFNTLVVSPCHDSVNTKLHNLLQMTIIPYILSKGIWDLTYLECDSAIRDVVHSNMESKGILIHGHGHGGSVSGHDSQPIFDTGDTGLPIYMDMLEGKIMYSMSCNTGDLLGPKMVNEYGGLAFAGFDDYPPCGESEKYQRTLPFFWLRLLDGYTVGEAYSMAMYNYDYWIDWYNNAEPPPDQPGKYKAAAYTLTRLMDHFVVFGNMDARLVQYKQTDNQQVTINV